MRTIDADELTPIIVHAGRISGKVEFATIINGLIDSAPTVDAIPIIRCKDCKHKVLNSQMNTWVCLFSDFIQPEHYCGYAERKEE